MCCNVAGAWASGEGSASKPWRTWRVHVKSWPAWQPPHLLPRDLLRGGGGTMVTRYAACAHHFWTHTLTDAPPPAGCCSAVAACSGTSSSACTWWDSICALGANGPAGHITAILDANIGPPHPVLWADLHQPFVRHSHTAAACTCHAHAWSFSVVTSSTFLGVDLTRDEYSRKAGPRPALAPSPSVCHWTPRGACFGWPVPCNLCESTCLCVHCCCRSCRSCSRVGCCLPALDEQLRRRARSAYTHGALVCLLHSAGASQVATTLGMGQRGTLMGAGAASSCNGCQCPAAFAGGGSGS